jgi:hypothetical protein
MQMTGLGLKMEELEKLVIGLYYNQNETFRDVQKIIRQSPGDIRLNLDKANPHSKSNNPKQTQSSQAFQMFEEGSLPIQVANTLGLREKEISELYSGGISVVCMNYTRSNKS